MDGYIDILFQTKSKSYLFAACSRIWKWIALIRKYIIKHQLAMKSDCLSLCCHSYNLLDVFKIIVVVQIVQSIFCMLFQMDCIVITAYNFEMLLLAFESLKV